MPVSKQDFDEAQQPLRDRILSFLEENSDKAFVVYEIFAQLQGYNDMALSIFLIAAGSDEKKLSRILGPYRQELKELESEGKVRSGVIRGQTHYCIADKHE